MKKLVDRINTFSQKYGGILTIAGLVLSIGAIAFAVYVSKQAVEARNIPRKELTCILNYSQKLITRNTSDNDFKVFYKDIEISDPYIFSITIQNTGDYAIANGDFKSDFSINMLDCNKIISASVVESTNEAITEEVLTNAIYNGTALSVTDFFLNPGESFTVHIISDGKPSSVRYSARIEDIPNLTIRNVTSERIERLKQQHNTFFTTILVFVLIAVCALAIWSFAEKKRFEKMLLKYKEDTTDA